jgi:hypothetical protein
MVFGDTKFSQDSMDIGTLRYPTVGPALEEGCRNCRSNMLLLHQKETFKEILCSTKIKPLLA